MHLQKQWQTIGKHPHHGINTPLFFILSEQSSGIGEFLDFIPLGKWCKSIGFDIIQTLPLNDTGSDTSPYNSLSAFALNPIHLSLRALNEGREIAGFAPLNQGRRVPYERLRDLKEAFLREYSHKKGKKILISPSFIRFLEDQAYWLKPYALFKALKKKFSGKHFKEWGSYSHVDQEGIEVLFQKMEEECLYHCLVQFLCYNQLKEAKRALNKMGVFLKGDIPILISPDSADVFAYPHLFKQDLEAGAPPDMYAEEGQNWGFPLYAWEAHQKEDFFLWKKRLAYAANFYDLYRLDHIIGFFRIWAIPKGLPAVEGAFIPKETQAFVDQGTLLLQEITESSPMLPIGEDLGVIPNEARAVLNTFQIPGTKVIRWERNWEGDQSFIPLSDYPPLSMTTLSTHDSDPLPTWWQSETENAKLFCESENLPWDPSLGFDLQKEILKKSHLSSSLFHINLLQEYFFLFDNPTLKRIGRERINTPGVLSKDNWTLRAPIPVESWQEKPLKEALGAILSKNFSRS